MTYILAISYNRPRLSSDASWDVNGITVLNFTQHSYSPARVFVDTNNTWYTVQDNDGHIFSGMDASMNSSPVRYGGYGIFVTASGNVYSYDGGHNQVNVFSANATESHPVMLIGDNCRGLFIDTNNTLYCSLRYMHRVLGKSLSDSNNTLNTMAGADCSGDALNMLASPEGIFVDLNFSLYVADSDNHRIQRFNRGQLNATTVAGNGASGTISLSHPKGVVLDGDGHLFIVDSDHHRIVGSGPDGFRCVAGCTNSSGSATYQLSSPQGMSFDSYGNIWVADSNNRRVQKFNITANPLGVFDRNASGEGLAPE